MQSKKYGLALAAGDAATAERGAHSLKGAAATLGATTLAEAAARAETAVQTGQGVEGALKSLSTTLVAVVEAIRVALPIEIATNSEGLGLGNWTRVINQHVKEHFRRSRERWRDPLLTVLTILLALLLFVIAPLHAAGIIESQDVGLVVGLVVIGLVIGCALE